jgi:prolipoprotein diacylglyceryl transferase
MLAVAGLIAITVAASRAALAGFERAQIVDFGILAVLWGVVGARAFHVIENTDLYFGPDRFVELEDVPGEGGARIALVVPGSPPAFGGLRVGDVVTALDGRPVSRADDVLSRVDRADPAARYRVEYVRGGARGSLQTRLRSGARGLTGALAIWNGGLVFYGGLIGGMLYALYFAARQRDGLLSLVRMYDLAGPCVLLGLAFGRVGCFLNGCCFGSPSGLWCSVAYPRDSNLLFAVLTEGHKSAKWKDLLPMAGEGLDAHLVPATYHVHPQQLYESVACLAIFTFLSWAFYRRMRLGTVSALWLLTYPVHRFIMEGWFRGDLGPAFPSISGTLTISQYVSILGFASGVVWGGALLWLHVKDRRKARAGVRAADG